MSASSQAAPPLLGSNLLVSAQAHESARPLPANSGSSIIDQNALGGGFRYGEITSIAGASGTGKTLVGTRSLMLKRIVFRRHSDRLESLSSSASLVLIARPFKAQS